MAAIDVLPRRSWKMRRMPKKKISKTHKVDKWEAIHKSAYPSWEIIRKPLNIKNPILIEGMPGIGNVGKISMDFLIEESGAQPMMSFFSRKLPNSVFVNEENLIELPKISLYHKKIGGKDFLFLTGDVQPMSEEASYEFSEMIIDIFKELDGDYIVTLGGIGLSEIPDNPKVYLTGNEKAFVDDVSKRMHLLKLKHEDKIYGLVGPILGVSGLLLGIAKKHDIHAYSLLAETFGHPMYVGLKGAKVILLILNSYYAVGIDMSRLEREIGRLDAQLAGIEGASDDPAIAKYRKSSDINYIG